MSEPGPLKTKHRFYTVSITDRTSECHLAVTESNRSKVSAVKLHVIL